MLLKGACHCGVVRFSVQSHHPYPSEHTHIMLDFAAPWVEVPQKPDDRYFARYPEESIADWHQRLSLTMD